MIHLIVGHRGCGKTAFLDRVRYYASERRVTCHTFDLDKEIESRTGHTVTAIFENHGEAGFRSIENQVLHQLVREAAPLSGLKFIAVGAGYAGEIPRHCQVIWLRRPTDADGRVFLDRPRLNPETDPMTEYLARFKARESKFREIYHRMITVLEGWESINDFEAKLLGWSPADVRMSVTVLPEHVAGPTRMELFIEHKVLAGTKYFELRTDLFSTEAIADLVKRIPSEKILLSFRKPDPEKRLLDLAGSLRTDWALELGPSPFEHNYVISLHERATEESMDEAAARLKSQKAEHYKFAPMVNDFTELWSGHRFFTEDTNRHSFLPRSNAGRWKWYRQLRGPEMEINFYRDGDGEGAVADQPLMFETLNRPRRIDGFAAVLGWPVSHSRTPAEHHDYFADKDMAVVAVEMDSDECNALNLGILQRMGLKAAAVTSPLKTKMKTLCSHIDRRAEETNAVNTIRWNEKSQSWSGTNTDILGLKLVMKEFQLPGEVCVWGGGGTRQVLRELLPNAKFFSARRGEPIWIEDESVTIQEPKALVWAVGRNRMDAVKTPPPQWRPDVVFDLNYTADSPGLEYAMKTGAKYISGRAFFKAQARAQREVWN